MIFVMVVRLCCHHYGSAVLCFLRSYPRSLLFLPRAVGFLRRPCLRSGPTVEQLTADLGAAKHHLSHGLAQQWLWCAVSALTEYRKRSPNTPITNVPDPTGSSNGTQQGFFFGLYDFENGSGASSLDSVLGLLFNCFFEETPALDFV